MAIMILFFPPNDEIKDWTEQLAKDYYDCPQPFGSTRLFTTNQIYQAYDHQDQLKQDNWDNIGEQLENSLQRGDYLFHPSILS
jgi:hypothetical protein